MDLLKDKKILAALAVVVVLLIGGGYYFFVAGRSDAPVEETEVGQEESIETLSPDQIGLTLEASPNNRQVKILIAKASDIKSLEYELTYDADIPPDQQIDGETGKVTRALTGEAELEGEESYESDFLDLGTCSSGTCRYDTGVESVNIILKITKTDGKIYQVEDSLEL